MVSQSSPSLVDTWQPGPWGHHPQMGQNEDQGQELRLRSGSVHRYAGLPGCNPQESEIRAKIRGGDWDHGHPTPLRCSRCSLVLWDAAHKQVCVQIEAVRATGALAQDGGLTVHGECTSTPVPRQLQTMPPAGLHEHRAGQHRRPRACVKSGGVGRKQGLRTATGSQKSCLALPRPTQSPRTA